MQQGRNSNFNLYTIMKKTIRNIFKVILMVIVCAAFIGMFGEKADGSMCIPWTAGCLAALAVSSKILEKMGAFNKEED